MHSNIVGMFDQLSCFILLDVIDAAASGGLKSSSWPSGFQANVQTLMYLLSPDAISKAHVPYEIWTLIHIQMEMRNRRVNTSSDHHWISTSLCLGSNYTTVYVHIFKPPLHHMKYWFQSERHFERRQTQIHSTGYWCLLYGARELRVHFTSQRKSINTAARTKSAHLVHHYPK